MDKEYIDREYYCNNICRCPGTECDKTKCPIWIAPAADVAPVVHGTWKLLDNGDGVCDQCHKLQKHIWDVDNFQRFCGCCGAKMDGGDKGER